MNTRPKTRTARIHITVEPETVRRVRDLAGAGTITQVIENLVNDAYLKMRFKAQRMGIKIGGGE